MEHRLVRHAAKEHFDRQVAAHPARSDYSQVIGAQRASCIGWAFSLSAPLAAPFVYVRCVSSDHGQTVKITEVDGCATVLGVRMYYVLVTSFSNVSRPQLHVGLSFLSVVLVAFFFLTVITRFWIPSRLSCGTLGVLRCHARILVGLCWGK